MTNDQAAAYLAAFIDGEGHISCNATSRGRANKQVAFSNTDKQLFDRVIEIAAMIGLQFRVYFIKSEREKWSDKWLAYLKGGKPSFEAFRALVPLQCERKRALLDDIINSYMDMEAVYAKQRTSFQIICPICATPFYVFPADVKRGQGKYCSHSCASKARTTSVQIACTQCGEGFIVHKGREDTARFCSHRCVGLAQADRMRSMAKKAADARWHPITRT